jgi:Family of unknown function (DUF6299)
VRLRRRLLLSLVLGAAVPGALAASPVSAQPPSNDTFANATVISSVPFSETLDTTQATTDALDAEVLAACGVSIPVGATVWYAYTPPVDQLVSVSTVSSTYSTGVGVVTGAPGSFVAAACSFGSVSFFATAGQTYYIAVADIGGLTGGTLSISVTAPTPPELDLSVDRFGRFDAGTGAATVTGTATCTSGAFGQVFLSLTQQVGRIATISGFGFADLTCDGTEQPWSVTVFPSTGLFKGGQATVVADAFACNPAGCASDHVEQTIVLRH